VPTTHYEDFLARFNGRGEYACPCGTTHRVETRAVVAGPGALERSAQLLGRMRGGARLWVLSDENTEAAAGARWKAMAHPARLSSRVLPGEPRLHPTGELVDQLSTEVKELAPDLLVAVGSGVVSDLVKRVALLRGLPNWCVATAPSVDAYSSATAAITIDGYHGALPAGITEVIVCDLDVMQAAPRELFLAGLGDLLAKYLAHLDWNLARMVTGEEYCPFLAATALDSARTAISAASMGAGSAEAVATLTDAGLCSGFAMQALRGSRSAASAEHSMAHFWEATHAVGNERLNLHGLLVGAASRVVLCAYRSFYGRLRGFAPDIGARLTAFRAEPPWDAALDPGLAPLLPRIREEMAARRLDEPALAARAAAFTASRTRIMEVADGMIEELGAAVGALERLGYPFALSGLELAGGAARTAFMNARLLRRRYTSFDLAYELGLDSFLRSEGERCLAAAD
jgi:glycerol-1-phosphate dehydrogenase [NAD(P)+]